MKPYHAGFLVIILVISAIMVSGCTQPPVTPATPTPTPVASATPTASPTQTCVLVPGPVEVVPSYESVAIQVVKNTISTNPYITTTFSGGKGLGMCVLMETTVYRSDCKVENGRLANPQMNSNITLMGTTGTDLVVVNVTMTDGETYTVVNRLVPFGTAPPPT